MTQDYSNYRDEWRESGDPRWAWRVMRTCIERGDPFPDWCLDYLRGVADGIEKAKDDMRAALPRILNFLKGPGRRPHRRDGPRIDRHDSAGKARGKTARLHRDGYSNYRDEWRESGDPRWAWRVVRTCIEWPEPFPDWCLDYLHAVAEGIEKAKNDIRAALPRILGFPKGPGRRCDALRIEQFAVEFMLLVLRGNSPGKARGEAAGLCGMGNDDKELAKYLRNFFNVKSLPTRSQERRWKLIILQWCINHPDCFKRYPKLSQPEQDGKSAFDFR
jgi:hypothetical protein